MRAFHRILTAAAGAALLAPAAAGAQAPATIQPGDGTGSCTLGWLFDGSDGHVYFGTAAHCFALGSPVDVAGERIGVVTHRGADERRIDLDVALVRVRPEMAPRVAGALRGHPDIPTGVISPADAAAGDRLQLSGWGTGFDSNPATREQRQGVFASGTQWIWQGVAPLTWGDSGGPITHLETGKAIGLNKGGGCEEGHALPCSMWGPSMAAVDRLAASTGLKLTLRLAGAPPPPPAPEPSPPAQEPPPAGQDAPPPAEPAASVTLRAPRLTVRRARRFAVSVTSTRPLRGVRLRLIRGGRTAAAGTARSFEDRARVALRARGRVRPGRHRLVLVAADDLGRPVRADVAVRVRR